MGSIAHAVRYAFDLVLRPFDGLAPLWALVAASLVTAVAILLVVRATTPARWIERARSQIAACIYEIRLFLDSPGRILRIQGRLLYWSGAYILALTPAFVVMTVPMGLLFLQLDLRYGYEPLSTRAPVVVRVDLDGATGDVEASAGDWGRVTAPPLHDAERGRVYLRVAIDEPGTHELTISAGDRELEKRLVATPAATRVSPERRAGAAMWWALTDEPPIPSGSGIAAISVAHPDASDDYLWMPWWLAWLVLSTVLALILRRPLGVSL